MLAPIFNTVNMKNKTILFTVVYSLREVIKSIDEMEWEKLTDKESAIMRKVITSIGSARTECLEIVNNEDFNS